MPIDLKELKELPEEFCYSLKPGILQAKIFDFLKKNKGTAYLCTEIAYELNKDLRFEEKEHKKGTIYRSLTLILKRKTNKNIHKKGSYYYYEEEKSL